MVYQEKYMMCVIAWVFLLLKDKLRYIFQATNKPEEKKNVILAYCLPV